MAVQLTPPEPLYKFVITFTNHTRNEKQEIAVWASDFTSANDFALDTVSKFTDNISWAIEGAF